MMILIIQERRNKIYDTKEDVAYYGSTTFNDDDEEDTDEDEEVEEELADVRVDGTEYHLRQESISCINLFFSS